MFDRVTDGWASTGREPRREVHDQWMSRIIRETPNRETPMRETPMRETPIRGSLPRAEVLAALRAAGCVFAEDETRLLLRGARELQPDDPGAVLPELVERRVAGEPLEVVLGWASFRGRRIGVRPGVFVPRRRTEFLVVRAKGFLVPGDVLVDLCCGTGAVAVALAAEVAALEVHAADIDPVAVDCARENLAPLGGTAHLGDLFDALPGELAGRIAVLTVNAPYVPTAELALMPPEAREHESVVALDGGADGVDLHRRVAASASAWLAPGGRVLIETSRRQAALTAAALTTGGLASIVRRSRDGQTAVAIGTRAGSSLFI